MRLWSLHPSYLDAKGLVALWREALLAQKVLQGLTKGYRNHPQLTRFKKQPDPLAAIAAYLHKVQAEAEKRGYHFDASKIPACPPAQKISVTQGQLAYEYSHLLDKLEVRDASACLRLKSEKNLKPHPLFKVIRGEVESWEVVPEDG